MSRSVRTIDLCVRMILGTATTFLIHSWCRKVYCWLHWRSYIESNLSKYTRSYGSTTGGVQSGRGIVRRFSHWMDTNAQSVWQIEMSVPIRGLVFEWRSNGDLYQHCERYGSHLRERLFECRVGHEILSSRTVSSKLSCQHAKWWWSVLIGTTKQVERRNRDFFVAVRRAASCESWARDIELLLIDWLIDLSWMCEWQYRETIYFLHLFIDIYVAILDRLHAWNSNEYINDKEWKWIDLQQNSLVCFFYVRAFPSLHHAGVLSWYIPECDRSVMWWCTWYWK